MDVTSWYNKRKGQSLLVPGAAEADRGQCVQAVDYWLNEGLGFPYVWANAKDWWNLPGSLAGNFNQITDGSIKAGDFVVYSEGLVKYGHIDVAAQDGTTLSYIGYDSNWGGDKTLHTVNHNQQQYNKYIIGTIRKIGEPMFNEGDRGNINDYLYGKDLKRFGGAVGKEWKDAMYFGVFETPEYKTDALMNAGDVDALNKATGRKDGNTQVGKTWKDIFYLYILPNSNSQYEEVTVYRKVS